MPDVPEGQRSGEGADSVLPYLMEALRSKLPVKPVPEEPPPRQQVQKAPRPKKPQE